MNVLVLISGVADPKWPLPPQADAGAIEAHSMRHAVLSPFDEAALELALQVRDADPQTSVHALVAGPESLARKVAEWRLDEVLRLAAGTGAAWDARAHATSLAEAALPQARQADVLLIGREFGDWDDGSVPALLAHAWEIAHLPLVLGLDLDAGRPRVTFQRGGALERTTLGRPALLSVTNDARNRLRHPLMKNVMAARKAPIASRELDPTPAVVQRTGQGIAVQPQRASRCQMISGGAEDQARALAELLRAEGAVA